MVFISIIRIYSFQFRNKIELVFLAWPGDGLLVLLVRFNFIFLKTEMIISVVNYGQN